MDKAEIINALAFLGAAALIITVGAIIYIAYFLAKEKIKEVRYNYHQKHRFDKPPTADCWCRDCIYLEGHKCRYMKCDVGERCFCWRARPIPYKEGKDDER